MKEVQGAQFQDPADRRDALDGLKYSLEDFYADRSRKLYDLLSLDCRNYTQATAQKYIDEMRALYDRSFEHCEKNADIIMKLRDECMTRVDA